MPKARLILHTKYIDKHAGLTAPYRFTAVDQLVTDFLSDVAAAKEEMPHES